VVLDCTHALAVAVVLEVGDDVALVFAAVADTCLKKLPHVSNHITRGQGESGTVEEMELHPGLRHRGIESTWAAWISPGVLAKVVGK
jgi:hypothetical protein